MDAGPRVVAHLASDCRQGQRVTLSVDLDRSGNAVMSARPESAAGAAAAMGEPVAAGTGSGAGPGAAPGRRALDGESGFDVAVIGPIERDRDPGLLRRRRMRIGFSLTKTEYRESRIEDGTCFDAVETGRRARTLIACPLEGAL